MKYAVLVQTMVNEQPEHVFVAEYGVTQAKILDVFLDVVESQYQRLERGKPDMYLVDFQYSDNGVIMSRAFGDGVTTVNVFYCPVDEARPYYEAQNALKN